MVGVWGFVRVGSVGGHLELVAQGVEELADLEEAQQLEEPHEAQSLEQLDELERLLIARGLGGGVRARGLGVAQVGQRDEQRMRSMGTC